MVLINIKNNYNAYNAGLRNGMIYLDAKNTANLKDARNLKKPIIITVLLNEKERKYEYYPDREKVKFKQFVVKS